MRKMVAVGELLSMEAIELLQANKGRKDFHRWCMEEVVPKHIDRINKVTKQENDPDYLAYLFEYVSNL